MPTNTLAAQVLVSTCNTQSSPHEIHPIGPKPGVIWPYVRDPFGTTHCALSSSSALLPSAPSPTPNRRPEESSPAKSRPPPSCPIPRGISTSQGLFHPVRSRRPQEPRNPSPAAAPVSLLRAPSSPALAPTPSWKRPTPTSSSPPTSEAQPTISDRSWQSIPQATS